MPTPNPVRSLMFWRTHKPERLAEARARGTRDACPICKGQQRLLVSGVEPLPEEPLLVDCACQAIEHEDRLAALVSQVDRAPESLPIFSTLEPRKDVSWLPMLEAARSLVQRPDNHRWLSITGVPGTGKTHLLLAIRQQLSGIAAYVEAGELSKRMFLALRDQSLAELEEALVSVPVLIVDDLGTEHMGAELILTAFSNFLNQRFLNALDYPTVLATNLDEELLKPRYPRVVSRLADKTLVDRFTLKLGDYRPLKGKPASPADPPEKYGFSSGGGAS